MNNVENKNRITLSVSELAETLGICEKAAYNLVRSEDFPASFKLGGRWLVSVSKLEEWAREQAESRL